MDTHSGFFYDMVEKHLVSKHLEDENKTDLLNIYVTKFNQR